MENIVNKSQLAHAPFIPQIDRRNRPIMGILGVLLGFMPPITRRMRDMPRARVKKTAHGACYVNLAYGSNLRSPYPERWGVRHNRRWRHKTAA